MRQSEASSFARDLRVPGLRHLACTLSVWLLIVSPTVFASEVAAEVPIQTLYAGELSKKDKSIRGGWRIERRESGAVLVLREDFKARSGPDLKVFLSPTDFSSLRGGNAVAGSIALGELKSNRGSQEYVIPAGVDLGAFKSVIVHCEAYSVVWGGSALVAASGADGQ